jgi:hypothetical protein
MPAIQPDRQVGEQSSKTINVKEKRQAPLLPAGVIRYFMFHSMAHRQYWLSVSVSVRYTKKPTITSPANPDCLVN